MSASSLLTDSSSNWIVFPNKVPNADIHLFCFPYAGGGASVFRLWSDALPKAIQLGIIQLPGRENRLREIPFNQLEPLIESLSKAILPYLDKPCIFLGYSMGALISFELAHFLRRHYDWSLSHLIVAACRSVQLPVISPIYSLPDAEFISELNQRYKAIPRTVWENHELMQAILPALRADFQLLETYHLQHDSPLQSPITAIGGEADLLVSEEDISAWKEQTACVFRKKMLPGGHFFLNSSHHLLVKLVQDIALSTHSRYQLRASAYSNQD